MAAVKSDFRPGSKPTTCRSDQYVCQTSPSPILRLSATVAYASGPGDLMQMVFVQAEAEAGT